MTPFRYPSIFLAHGTPMHAFGEDTYQETLFNFGKSMPKPKAVVIVSAHAISNDQIHILKTEVNSIQHDFGGFPEALYQIDYQTSGSPEIADQVLHLMQQAGLPVKVETRAPLDHGIWIPLSHLYPKGDVPVVRISLPINLLPAQILKMGHALAQLREQGVLIAGSGSAVHNLGLLEWSKKHSEGADWAIQFEEWLIQTLKLKNVEGLMNYEEHPYFFKAHPTAEHFLPILFIVGSALPGDEFSIIMRGIEYSTLSMLSFSLNHEKNTSALH